MFLSARKYLYIAALVGLYILKHNNLLIVASSINSSSTFLIRIPHHPIKHLNIIDTPLPQFNTILSLHHKAMLIIQRSPNLGTIEIDRQTLRFRTWDAPLQEQCSSAAAAVGWGGGEDDEICWMSVWCPVVLRKLCSKLGIRTEISRGVFHDVVLCCVCCVGV